MESLCRFDLEIPDRVAESLSELPDIVLSLLQTVQEGEESVAGFVATRGSIGRGCLGKCLLLHGKCRFEINLCGFNMFVTEPQCDRLVLCGRPCRRYAAIALPTSVGNGKSLR